MYMNCENFFIIEEFNNFSSNVDLAKAINKYAPRAVVYHFREFIEQLSRLLPNNFFINNHAIICSTNNKSLIDFYKTKFSIVHWKVQVFDFNSRKKMHL